MNYCKCGSIIIKGICSNRGCPLIKESDAVKKRKWQIGETIIRSINPIIYTEAITKQNEYFIDAIKKGKKPNEKQNNENISGNISSNIF